MTSQFSLCSHYLDVAQTLPHPDVFGKEAVLGSKWLSLKLNSVVPPFPYLVAFKRMFYCPSSSHRCGGGGHS